MWTFDTVAGAFVGSDAIGPLPGYARSMAVDVNNDCQVVGYSAAGSTPPFGNRPMVYDCELGTVAEFDFPATPVIVM